MDKSLIVCVAVALAAQSFATRLAADEVKPAAGSTAPLDLPNMLEMLGFEPRQVASPSGGVAVEIRNVRGTRETVILLSLSTDGRRLQITAPLKQGIASSREASEAYLRLLGYHYDNGLNVFALHGERLVLSRSLSTAGLTPATVRKAIDSIDGDLRATAVHWDVPALDPASNPATPSGPITAGNAGPAGEVTHLSPSPFRIEKP
jgi:hypothetical protein